MFSPTVDVKPVIFSDKALSLSATVFSKAVILLLVVSVFEFSWVICWDNALSPSATVWLNELRDASVLSVLAFKLVISVAVELSLSETVWESLAKLAFVFLFQF